MKVELQNKKEICENLIAANKNEIIRLELMEQYTSSQALIATSGKRQVEMMLGEIQHNLKEKKNLVSFLERKLLEL